MPLLSHLVPEGRGSQHWLAPGRTEMSHSRRVCTLSYHHFCLLPEILKPIWPLLLRPGTLPFEGADRKSVATVMSGRPTTKSPHLLTSDHTATVPALRMLESCFHSGVCVHSQIHFLLSPSYARFFRCPHNRSFLDNFSLRFLKEKRGLQKMTLLNFQVRAALCGRGPNHW